jgi:signal transduction histidine kinase
MRALADDLFENARGSAAQIEGAVRRMQRFTNLDRAESHPVDLRQLLEDVASMVEPGDADDVRIDFESEQLPKLTLRPQQMSAVFAKLLQNAVRVSPAHSTVAMRARCQNGSVEVSIADRGPGLDAKTVQNLFEPAFQVRDGKVVGGHWGLFAARQVVREHGGEILVRTEPGAGAEVVVKLPRDAG